jgi:pimeloyl-ACP methyl ester carboxylesterase
MNDTKSPVERRCVAGIELEVFCKGQGKPILVLHGFQHIDPRAAFVSRLATHAQVIAPSHPGFGNSARPEGFDTVYDLVQLYHELIETLGNQKVVLMGLSFGGWLAAELALVASHRVERLVLVDALGIKVSDRETPDILDVFNSHPDAVARASWHDMAKFRPDYDEMEDAALVNISKNWAALARYGWHPYMYNPQLKAWLKRIRVPTLVLWGASDGIVKPQYGKAYAELIPGARFVSIPEAGHHPEIEQPARFAELVAEFVKG